MKQPITLDKYFFQYIADKLKDSTIEQKVAYYVENLVFHNSDYLKYLQAKYNLPNDMLKMHDKFVKLASILWEGMREAGDE